MIIVDSQEPMKMFEKLKKNLENGVVKREQLKIGDYLVKVDEIELAVERKNTVKGDYVSSMVDGRLNNQLYDMSTSYDLSVLLIEGYISQSLSRRDFSRHQYISSLSKALLKRSPEGKQGQIAIVSTETEYDTRLFLRDLHRHLTEGIFERLPLIPGRKSNPESAKLALLRQIPHIGKKRSRKLHKQVGSLKTLFNTPKGELQDIMGNKIGEDIYKFLREV